MVTRGVGYAPRVGRFLAAPPDPGYFFCDVQCRLFKTLLLSLCATAPGYMLVLRVVCMSI